jgi:hypothetical protein
MSYQSKQVVKALPGTLPELADRTGYSYAKLLLYIAEARALGTTIYAWHDPAQQTVYMRTTIGIKAVDDPATQEQAD